MPAPPTAPCPICASPREPRPYLRWRHLAWVRCPACTGGWQEPYTSELDRDDPAVGGTYDGYEPGEDLFRGVAREKARWVAGHLGPGYEVVEAGAGLGLVAASLRDLRPGIPYHVLEPNPRFGPRLRAAGLEVREGAGAADLPTALAEIRERGGRAVVFLDNVLEHVPFPHALVAALHAAAPPGSVLLLEVPNEAGLRWRAPVHDLLRGFRKPPTFPGHVNLFTARSLSRLSRSLGLPVRVRPHPVRTEDHLRYLTQRPDVPPLARLALAALGALPLDRALGVAYWLRAAVPLGL